MPKGKIFRKGFSFKRKDGTLVKVPGKYIIDRGMPGKGPKLIPKLKKGMLSRIGYNVNNGDVSRHRALNKGVEEYSKNTMIKRLNAVSIFLKNTSPKKSEIFRKDTRWLSEKK